MKVLIFVLMFFVLSALVIISNNGLALSDDENLKEFGDLYLNWAERIYSNVQGVTGEVVRMEWLPK